MTPKATDAMKALEESIKLQSHYAELLNMHDGGKRMTFENADEWMNRLRHLNILAAAPSLPHGDEVEDIPGLDEAIEQVRLWLKIQHYAQPTRGIIKSIYEATRRYAAQRKQP